MVHHDRLKPCRDRVIPLQIRRRRPVLNISGHPITRCDLILFRATFVFKTFAPLAILCSAFITDSGSQLDAFRCLRIGRGHNNGA